MIKRPNTADKGKPALLVDGSVKNFYTTKYGVQCPYKDQSTNNSSPKRSTKPKRPQTATPSKLKHIRNEDGASNFNESLDYVNICQQKRMEITPSKLKSRLSSAVQSARKKTPGPEQEMEDDESFLKIRAALVVL